MFTTSELVINVLVGVFIPYLRFELVWRTQNAGTPIFFKKVGLSRTARACLPAGSAQK